MHLPTALSFATAASATALEAGQHASFMALRSVMERQLQICKPITAPFTCERSCGAGYVTCVSFPTCYNPSAGEKCCSNGSQFIPLTPPRYMHR